MRSRTGNAAAVYVTDAAAAVEADRQRSTGAVSAARYAALAHGFDAGPTYRDAPGWPRRSGRSALLRDAHAGRFAAVAVASLDALGRDLADLVRTLVALRAAGVRVVVGPPGGPGEAEAEALAAALPALVAARDAMHRASAAAGRARARARGVRFGRPPVGAEAAERVLEALAQGASLRTAARRGGVGAATAARLRDRALREGAVTAVPA